MPCNGSESCPAMTLYAKHQNPARHTVRSEADPTRHAQLGWHVPVPSADGATPAYEPPETTSSLEMPCGSSPCSHTWDSRLEVCLFGLPSTIRRSRKKFNTPHHTDTTLCLVRLHQYRKTPLPLPLVSSGGNPSSSMPRPVF